MEPNNPTTPYRVRRAELRDIPRILELLVQVDMVHHRGRPDIFNGPATKYNAAELEGILSDESTPVFVCANADDTAIGHAFCIHKETTGDAVLADHRTLYIDDICVDEAARGLHIGTMLYEAVAAYAREQGFYNITLNVWECNPGARQFYTALGLRPRKTEMETIL